MSRKIEIKCDICGRLTRPNEKIKYWGGIGTSDKSTNINLGFDNIDICPECIIKVSNFIKSIKAGV